MTNEQRTARGHRHPEAFCLMRYATSDHTEDEWIWNARDGVTPFIVSSRTGREMSHIDWHRDQYLPDYQPKTGERMFVDLTPGRARQIAERQVNRWWDDPRGITRTRFASKQEAVKSLLDNMMRHEGQPDVVVVGGRAATREGEVVE